MDDNFDFSLVRDFLGYVSSKDKTTVSPNALVTGSQNVYKTLGGTIANRFGKKLYGSVDSSSNAVKSSYEWYTSTGKTYPIRVLADGKLQFEDVSTHIWTTLTTLTGTRAVFDTWYDKTEAKDRLLLVYGASTVTEWSGGRGILDSVISTSERYKDNGAALTQFAISRNNAVTNTIIVDYNGLVGANLAEGAITLTAQPTAGDFIQIIAKTAATSVTTININFVAAIGVAAGNVLIGANLAATWSNLLGLLNAPGTTSATQVAVSSDAQTILNALTKTPAYAIKNNDSGKTWAQDGFSSTNLLDNNALINGNSYTYEGGVTTLYLTGVLPNPSGEAAGSIVLQPPRTISGYPAANYNADFIKTIGNRVHVGSYTSRLVYISSNIDYGDFTVPTPRTPGAPELLTLDNAPTAISVRQGNAHISAGLSDWYEVSYTNITVGSTLTQQTLVDKKPTSNLGAAIFHEMVDTVGDNIIYMSKDQQVRIFGTFRNLTESKYPSISQQIHDELEDIDFTGGALRVIGDFTYITAPAAGKDYLYQSRELVNGDGNVVSERLWHPPQLRDISRIALINGIIYGHSKTYPQAYQLWDTGQWHDDIPTGGFTAAYTCTLSMAYRQLRTTAGLRKQGLLKFDKLYTEGYMAKTTTLTANVYFDYNGATLVKNLQVNGSTNAAIFYPATVDTYPKFRAIRNTTIKNVFEYGLELTSSTADARWEILYLGVNPVFAPDATPNLIK